MVENTDQGIFSLVGNSALWKGKVSFRVLLTEATPCHAVQSVTSELSWLDRDLLQSALDAIHRSRGTNVFMECGVTPFNFIFPSAPLELINARRESIWRQMRVRHVYASSNEVAGALPLVLLRRPLGSRLRLVTHGIYHDRRICCVVVSQWTLSSEAAKISRFRLAPNQTHFLRNCNLPLYNRVSDRPI